MDGALTVFVRTPGNPDAGRQKEFHAAISGCLLHKIGDYLRKNLSRVQPWEYDTASFSHPFLHR